MNFTSNYGNHSYITITLLCEVANVYLALIPLGETTLQTACLTEMEGYPCCMCPSLYTPGGATTRKHWLGKLSLKANKPSDVLIHLIRQINGNIYLAIFKI